MKNCVRTFAACLSIAVTSLVSAPASAAPCSASTIVGTYGFTIQGFYFQDRGPNPATGRSRVFAAAGTTQFNADGTAVRTFTISIDGEIFNVTDSGTFEVLPNCTGQGLFNTPIGLEPWKLTIVGQGNAILLINGLPGIVVAGRLERQ